MDEHKHRRVGRICRKNVQRLLQRGAKGHVQRVLERGAGQRALRHKVLARCRRVGQRNGGVVLRVYLRLGGELAVQRGRCVGHWGS